VRYTVSWTRYGRFKRGTHLREKIRVELRAQRHGKLSLHERRAGLDGPTRSLEFERFLRFGMDGVKSQEMRAQGVGSDVAGGFLVASEFSDQLWIMLKQVDPLFDEEVVTVIDTATGGPYPIPILDDTTGTAAIVAENTISTVADIGPFSQVVLPTAPTWRSPLVKCSIELSQDAAYPIDEMLAQAFATRFQRGIGASLVTVLTTGGAVGVTAGATAITLDNLHDMVASVDPEYQKSPKLGWLMRLSTLIAIRKLESAGVRQVPAVRDANGRPLVLDIPVFICPSMPAIATGTKSVMLGALDYLVVRRVADSIRIKRLGERFATELAVGFTASIRVNAALARATGADSPVKWLVHA
jgi:HK97 family phage major capsid protein